MKISSPLCELLRELLIDLMGTTLSLREYESVREMSGSLDRRFEPSTDSMMDAVPVDPEPESHLSIFAIGGSST